MLVVEIETGVVTVFDDARKNLLSTLTKKSSSISSGGHENPSSMLRSTLIASKI